MNLSLASLDILLFSHRRAGKSTMSRACREDRSTSEQLREHYRGGLSVHETFSKRKRLVSQLAMLIHSRYTPMLVFIARVTGIPSFTSCSSAEFRHDMSVQEGQYQVLAARLSGQAAIARRLQQVNIAGRHCPSKSCLRSPSSPPSVLM
jgi:hypothetical protein